MPPLDRTKTLASAEKLVKTGKLVEAIAEYKKLADDNPRDMNNFNKLGDLYLRAGKTQDAIRHFLRIAEFYASDGFFLKAIAMYKKISKLDPSNMDCLQKLATLYHKQGLTIEARVQFKEVVDHFIKASQFKKAIEVLAQVLEMEPDNSEVRMRYADLLTRAGDAKESAPHFAQVARELAAKGKIEEALKVGQKGLKAVPGNSDLMSLMLSLSKEAQKSPDDLLASVVEMAKGNGDNPRSLALLGEAYLTAGKTKEAEQVFRKLSGMGDNAPPEVAAAVGRYHLSKDADGPALEWLGRAADGFLEASSASEATGLLDEFLRAFPDHRGGLARRAAIASQAGDKKGQAASLLRLAQIHIGASETVEASKALQSLVEIEPGNARYAEMLASLQARGSGAAAPASRPRPAPAPPEETLEAEEPALEIEPTAIGPGIGAIDATDELTAEEPEEEDAGEEVGPGSLIQDLEEEEDEEEEDDDFISEHFTEAEVFIKYGLLEKAKQQLLAILAKHAKHMPSHTKLKEIYYEEGNKDKAVEECLMLADLLKAKGRSEESREMINEAVRIDPNSARVKQHTGGAKPAAPAAKQPAAVPKPVPPAAKPAVAPAKAAPPQAKPAAPAPKPAPARAAKPAPVPELEIVEEVTETPSIEIEPEETAGDDISLELEIPDEPPEPVRPAPAKPAVKAAVGVPKPPVKEPPAPARPVPEKIEEETPEDLTGGLSFAGEGDEITIEIEEEGSGAPLGHGPGASRGPLAPAQASADPDAEKLGEVDFYIDQGLLEEARAVLFQLQRQFPESQEVLKRFERANRPAPTPEKVAPAEAKPVQEMTGLDLDVERAFGTQKHAAPRAVATAVPRGQKAKAVFKVETERAEPEGDFFDLASELDKSLAEAQVAVDHHEQESIEGPGHSLDEIFKAFKKGVEQQVDSSDYETHYNLGIAYKEMGLVDEAIGEFQFAAKDPARTVECCGILGLCFREKGMPDLALKWYRKGLDNPDLVEHESVGLRYDIAEIHREQGDYRKALQIFTEVYGVDSNYRDVSAKIKEMRKLLG